MRVSVKDVRGKMFLQSHGKHFFTHHGKQIFTLHGKQIFHITVSTFLHPRVTSKTQGGWHHCLEKGLLLLNSYRVEAA
jgi:hypothetical protein